LGKSAAAPTTNSSSINCIVTSGSLIPSLAKCLLYHLDDVVSSENGMPPVLEHPLSTSFLLYMALCEQHILPDDWTWNTTLVLSNELVFFGSLYLIKFCTRKLLLVIYLHYLY
jgi:hypothetical protein